MGDQATLALSEYVESIGVNISAIARGTKISDGILRRSLKAGVRDLRATEFLEVCKFLRTDPNQFYCPPNCKG